MADYDIIGNIAIIKSERDGKLKTKSQKLKEAKEILKRPSIKTVLEKASDIKGRLRTFKTKHIAGEKNLIAEYKENNCRFQLNVDECYFSPRQGNDRKNLAKTIKKNQEVLVMFSGICAYPLVIYKLAKPKKITAIEISRACNFYAKINKKLNKIPDDKLEIIQGDVKRNMPKKKYEVIVMVRPNLKTTFLEEALKVAKKGTKIHYQGFCRPNELKDLKKQLIDEAKSLKRNIKITKAIKAGDIAPRKYRYRLLISVLN